MADPKGFIKFPKAELPGERPVEQRVQDWLDTHIEVTGQPGWLRNQAARCMDCGVPFCHFGCPLGNLIPEWNDLFWRGQISEAIERMHATNNFPELTGRLCPAPCEYSCVLGIVSDPVTIRSIEQAIADAEYSEPLVPQPPARLTDRTVAIVGSGPAGLACAQQLTRSGHTVVVFEREDAIGGLLRYGIPDFKFEKHILDRRLAQMAAEGTRFRPGVNIGVDESWESLRRRFDAVVVAIGATVPIDLSLPGRELSGIHFAMDYLTRANRLVSGKEEQLEGRASAISSQQPNLNPDGAMPHSLDAAGKHVVIIGGGDTGSDCLGTALRQGAASVTTLDIHAQAPHERPETHPWPTMPKQYKVTSSQAEGGQIEYLASTVEFLSDGAGNVCGLRLGRTEFDTEGRTGGVEPESERDIPADLVLLAVGFSGPEANSLTAQLKVQQTDRGLIARDDEFATSADGVYVCGDAGRGQSLIVWAIAEGRSCAAAVHNYLRGIAELQRPINPSTKPLSALIEN